MSAARSDLDEGRLTDNGYQLKAANEDKHHFETKPFGARLKHSDTNDTTEVDDRVHDGFPTRRKDHLAGGILFPEDIEEARKTL